MLSTYLVYFLLAILLHELGHLAAARACSTTVREFGFGWGPKLMEFRLGKVNCVVRILPIVRTFGWI